MALQRITTAAGLTVASATAVGIALSVVFAGAASAGAQHAPVPTPTPTVIVTRTPTPSPSPTVIVTRTPTPSPSPTVTATRTPSPSPSPTRAQNDCFLSPSACGFPDATNTGVPAGTALLTVPGQISSGPGWYFDSRGWVEVNVNGTNLSGLYIPYTLDISASNVTVNHVQVVTSGQSSFGVSVRHTSGVTIENSTISGVNATNGRLMVGVKDIYADSTGLQVLNNDISMASTGVQLESGLVQGNYIHNVGYTAGDHINGVTSNGGGTALLTISHNSIFINYPQTDAISLFEDFGAQTNRVISNNLLAGGAYTIYAGQNAGGPTATNITISGNRISPRIYSPGGVYGPVADFNAAGAGNTWTGNVWDDTGQTITAP